VRDLACLVLAGAGLTALAQPALRPLDEKAYAQLISSHKGNVVLVDFWATWCAPCREEMPLLVQLERKHRSRGLRLVTVSCDEPEDQSKAGQFLTKHGAPQPAYLKRAAEDEKFIEFVSGKWSGALPAMFLYDRNGRLARSFIGETDMAVLEQAVLKLL